MRTFGALLVALVAAAAACYSPGIVDDQFRCGDRGACPPDFTCKCGQCVHPATAVKCGGGGDGGVDGGGLDAEAPDMLDPNFPCTVGPRADINAPHAEIAFCPAAFLAKGIATKDPLCGHKPRPDGKSQNGGVECTISDNCAVGWHVCEGDAEVKSKKLDMTACLNVSGFYATREATKNEVMLHCGMNGSAAILGCGKLGADQHVMQCQVLTSALNETVCSTPALTWTCSGVGMEATTVTKTGVDFGGVLCCKD